MAGFNITGSTSEYQKNNVAEIRRKHRWVFTKLGDILQQQELIYLQKASRPTFKFEEVKMSHDQEDAYFAGRQSWEPITFEWYDIQQDPNVSKRLWEWLQSVNPKLGSKSEEVCVKAPKDYKTRATLEMTGNCDNSPVKPNSGEEIWDFYGMWPKECKWNDLSYEDNAILTISVTARYDRAIRTK